MASGNFKKPLIKTEVVNLQFNNGAAFVSFKAGYYLISAVVAERPATETNGYAISSIIRRTDAYRLQNVTTTLTAKVYVVLVWVSN